MVIGKSDLHYQMLFHISLQEHNYSETSIRFRRGSEKETMDPGKQ
jgi:hypothetical protein